jgi:uncharacterized protein DUF6882
MSGSTPVTAASGHPFSAAFDRLGAALGAVVLRQQEALSEVLPREDWNADLTARTYTSGGVTVRVSLLGSYAEQERTWLWGWANTQFGPEHPAVVPTLAIRELGERLGVPELTTPEIDLSRYDGPAGHGGELVSVVATGLLGGGGYIGAGYPGGSAYLHVDDPRVPQAGWDPISAPRVLVNAISLFPGEHRLTVARFLSHHRIPYRETPRSIDAWPPASAPAQATFDETGRFTGWQAELSR